MTMAKQGSAIYTEQTGRAPVNLASASSITTTTIAFLKSSLLHGVPTFSPPYFFVGRRRYGGDSQCSRPAVNEKTATVNGKAARLPC